MERHAALGLLAEQQLGLDAFTNLHPVAARRVGDSAWG